MHRSWLTALTVFLVATACNSAPSMEGVPGNTRSPADPNAQPKPVAVTPYIFGFADEQGSAAAMTRARLVTAYLARVMGHPIEPRVFGYKPLADAIASGAVDFASLPPVAYVSAVQRSPKLLLLRQMDHRGSLSYRSALFVRENSGIRTIKQAKRKRLALVEAGSASGNVFPSYWMMQQGLNPQTDFSDRLLMADHGAVCQAVYEGRADVGASFTDSDTMNGLVDGCQAALGENTRKLRIIGLTEPIPNDVIVARADLPDGVADQIGDALDKLMSSEDGSHALHDGLQAEGLFAANDAQFDYVRRALNIPVPLRLAPAAKPAH